MISNAKDRPLFDNPGTLPNMGGALLNWFQKMVFTVVTKRINPDTFLVEEVQVQCEAMAVKQPLQAEKIQMKPEGQRHWRWEMLHALPDLVLKIDDIVRIGATPYRVMERFPYSEYGFVEYHITQDYKP